MEKHLRSFALPFMSAYQHLAHNGREVAPRNQKIKEVENFYMTLHPIKSRFTNFSERRMNHRYAKKEILWYLRGDRFDINAIVDEAQMWATIVDKDGGINSNYGQYIFQNQRQFFWVLEELSRDVYSRRAVMTLLNYTHLRPDNPDIVCTYSIGFRIRDNKLNMTIHMRSWDAIWGMTNDVFCFSCIYELMFVLLKNKYPDLSPGIYYHTADSFHVYERHFGMLDRLVKQGMDGYIDIDCPRISSIEEAHRILTLNEPESTDAFYTWLLSDSSKSMADKQVK